MTDHVTGEATIALGQRRSGRRVTTPAALLLLGILSVVLLWWMSALNKEQLANYALVDAIEDMHSKTAMAHILFEEALAKQQNADIEKAWANMAEARRLSAAILQGGQIKHNLRPHIPGNRHLVSEVEAVDGLLSKFKAIAEERYAHPETSGVGSELDRAFDDVHKEITGKLTVLEEAAEKTLRNGNDRIAWIILGAIFSWSLIIGAATVAIWSREEKRRRAEEALQEAKDELEVRVAERTRELAATNEQLSQELTARRQTEAENAILQKEAERAALLAALGEIVAGTAHEINNPINGIINCAEILVNKTAQGSRENELGRRIMKEGDRIAFIVKSLLSFAREETEEKVAIHVRNILTDALALTEAQLRKEGITLRLDTGDEELTINAHPQRLEQVFLNIINNARDALNQKYPEKSEKKTLSISTKRVTDGRPLARIAFHDRGTGIPAPILDKVKNPFFSTKPKGKGTGLGLSISQGIVANHGGNITIDSVEGEFTEVALELPLMEAG